LKKAAPSGFFHSIQESGVYEIPSREGWVSPGVARSAGVWYSLGTGAILANYKFAHWNEFPDKKRMSIIKGGF
jgi:hypothetical protein